eukprot:gene9313-19334_t
MSHFSIAIVGSSGGGAATMSSGEAIIETIRGHVRSIQSPLTQDLVNESTIPVEEKPKPSEVEKKSRRYNRRSSGIEYQNMLSFICAPSSRRSSAFILDPLPSNEIDSPLPHTQSKYHVDILACSFVICECALDFAFPTENIAQLWTLKNNTLQCQHSGILSDINIEAEKEDLYIASEIKNGNIHALVSISSDPLGVNKHSLQAAIDKGIPIVGTGGTSMSYISTHGGLVIGSSGGSVATTSISKSVCFAAALASHWDLEYYPPIVARGASIYSVAGATLPIFLSMALLKILLRYLLKYSDVWAAQYPMECVAQAILQTSTSTSTPGVILDSTKKSKRILSAIGRIFGKVVKGVASVSTAKYPSQTCTSSSLGYIIGALVDWSTRLLISIESRSLPLVVSVIACAETSGLAELSMLTGAAAGSLISDSILSGFIGGILCGLLLPWLLIFCARESLLPTTSTIIAIGLSAIISGVIASSITGWTTLFTEFIRNNIWLLPEGLIKLIGISPQQDIINWINIAYGALSGWLVSWGSEKGYYHLLILPLILIEMERADLSVFGTLDLVCLCVPSSAVCAAVWCLAVMYRKDKKDTKDTTSNSTSASITPLKALSNASVQTSTESTSNSPSSTSTIPTSTSLPSSGEYISTSNKQLKSSSKVQHYDTHIRVGRRGFVSGFFQGDFVEACYPYTQKHFLLLIIIRLCCAYAGVIIITMKIKSSAYLPVPLGILISMVDSDMETKRMDFSDYKKQIYLSSTS